MTCPYCQSHRLQKLKRTADLGYLRFRCCECGRKSNERTGTPFNCAIDRAGNLVDSMLSATPRNGSFVALSPSGIKIY